MILFGYRSQLFLASETGIWFSKQGFEPVQNEKTENNRIFEEFCLRFVGESYQCKNIECGRPVSCVYCNSGEQPCSWGPDQAERLEYCYSLMSRACSDQIFRQSGATHTRCVGPIASIHARRHLMPGAGSIGARTLTLWLCTHEPKLHAVSSEASHTVCSIPAQSEESDSEHP